MRVNKKTLKAIEDSQRTRLRMAGDFPKGSTWRTAFACEYNAVLRTLQELGVKTELKTIYTDSLEVLDGYTKEV